MQIDFGVLSVGGAPGGTLTHAAIKTTSTILLQVQRDISEDVGPMTVELNGFPRTGEVDWVLNQGHDNNVFLHYCILNA